MLQHNQHPQMFNQMPRILTEFACFSLATNIKNPSRIITGNQPTTTTAGKKQREDLYSHTGTKVRFTVSPYCQVSIVSIDVFMEADCNRHCTTLKFENVRQESTHQGTTVSLSTAKATTDIDHQVYPANTSKNKLDDLIHNQRFIKVALILDNQPYSLVFGVLSFSSQSFNTNHANAKPERLTQINRLANKLDSAVLIPVIPFIALQPYHQLPIQPVYNPPPPTVIPTQPPAQTPQNPSQSNFPLTEVLLDQTPLSPVASPIEYQSNDLPPFGDSDLFENFEFDSLFSNRELGCF